MLPFNRLVTAGTMSELDLKEYVQEKKGGKNSAEDQIEVAIAMYEQDIIEGEDVVRRTELSEILDDMDINLEYSLAVSLDHLEDANLVNRSISGPQIYIIHERRDEIVNGEDLEELVEEEVERFLEAMKKEPEINVEITTDGGMIKKESSDTVVTVWELIAEEMDVPEEEIPSELRSGDVPERMSKLEKAIDAVEEFHEQFDIHNNAEGDEYGRIIFRHNAYRYTLSGKAITLIEK